MLDRVFGVWRGLDGGGGMVLYERGKMGLNLPSVGAALVAPPTLPKPSFFGAAAVLVFPDDAVRPTCPKPNLATPIPNRSTSDGLRWCCAWLPPVLLEPVGLIGVVLITAGVSITDAPLALDSAASASGLYPNFSILSASAFAAFSAASKSMSSVAAPIFFAPSFVVFFAPRMFPLFAPAAAAPAGLRTAAAGVDRIAVGAGRLFSASCAVAARGDLGRPAPLGLPAERNGEPVREITGGVPVREGGFEGRLIVGLSQELKKSSLGSPAGVEAPSSVDATAPSSTMTSSGYLYRSYQMAVFLQTCCVERTLLHLEQPSSSVPPCICSPRSKCI